MMLISIYVDIASPFAANGIPKTRVKKELYNEIYK